MLQAISVILLLLNENNQIQIKEVHTVIKIRHIYKANEALLNIFIHV